MLAQRYILSDDNMTLNELYAAASLYVLMAVAFSFLLAAIEQMSGVLFLAIVISRLISMHSKP